MSERDALQAQTAAEALAATAQAAELRRLSIEEMVGHTIAFGLTGGFFLLALCVLLGFVEIKEPAVATMVGTIVGYAAANLSPLLFRYFKMVPAAPSDQRPGPVERRGRAGDRSVE